MIYLTEKKPGDITVAFLYHKSVLCGKNQDISIHSITCAYFDQAQYELLSESSTKTNHVKHYKNGLQISNLKWIMMF